MLDKAANSNISTIASRSHESINVLRDYEDRFQIIIAIHNTILGPAAGGCRLRFYPSIDLAIEEACRLSEAMSLKNALAGIPFGGGKAVINLSKNAQIDRSELFQIFAEFLSTLAGKYFTAEDMGTSTEDMLAINQVCRYVLGLPKENGGCGDPSPYTALGMLHGMRATLEFVFGKSDFSNRTILIQGGGHVGYQLAQHLYKEGAKLLICDKNREQAKIISRDFGAKIVDENDPYYVACDVFAPCAVGGILNPETVQKLRCAIVAGAANNQLSDASVDDALRKRNILYAPDFAINAGGIIACVDQLSASGFNHARVEKRVERIYDTMKDIFSAAQQKNISPAKLALHMAQDRIAQEDNCQNFQSQHPHRKYYALDVI